MSLRDIGRVKCHKENRIDNHYMLKRRRNCGSCTVKQIYSDYEVQMEHSYSRDSRPLEGANGLTTRTLMVHRPPQCPSCHSHPMDEGVELDEGNHPPIPSYNEQTAKESMNECLRIANSVRNLNSEEQDWEEHVIKIGWSPAQEKLFSKVARILDLDHLARLATNGKQHEPVQRRVIIDKSVQRMRQALASVSWDSRLTQWIHVLLMENLPPSYMAIYLDILQTLKTKLPTLMDKMLFGKPMNINQDLLTPVMKKQWDPVIAQKTRKLPANAVIVVIPSTVSNVISSRMQRWYQLLATIAQIVQINIPGGGNALSKQPIDQVAEQLISISRVKIQDLRSEQPSRNIILVGFNAGAALALQIALAENVNSVVCLGFAFNTINGIRGEPDDHILEITTPIMFVIGQNSSKTSQEEMESLREKLQSETSLVVVGSADDVLRVPKNKRQIEGITQSMVDNMITDEVYEFIQNCIANPPGPRIPTYNIGSSANSNLSQVRRIGSGAVNAAVAAARKRKLSQSSDSDATQNKTKCLQNRGVLKPPKKPKFHDPFQVKRKVGRPRTRPIHQITAPAKQPLLSQPSTEVLNMAIQSILPDTDKPISNLKRDDSEEEGQIVSTYEIITQPTTKSHNVNQISAGSSSVVIPINSQRNTATATSIQKVKMVPQGQYLQLKSTPQTSQQKIFTIKTSPMITSSNQSSSSGDTIRNNQSQVFTVKTTPPSQYIQSSILNPQKFTVIKPGTSLINAGSDNTVKNITTTDLSSANIFDIPIVFADNDGNLHDTAPITTTAPISTSSSQIIITQPQNQEQTVANKGYVFNSAAQKNKPNKVVFINRNTMKPCSSIISKAVPPLKYTKVVVTNPKTSTPSLVNRAPGPSDPNKTMTTITIQKPKTMELAPGTVVKTTTFPGQSGTSILNSVAASGNKQYQPIIINVDSDKTTIKSMIKVGEHQQIKPTILLKPGGVKQIPVLKPGILNRNLTVRKVVNLIPGKTGTPTTLHQISAPVTGTITTSANQIIDTD